MNFRSKACFLTSAGLALLLTGCVSDQPQGESARITPGHWDVVSVGGTPLVGQEGGGETGKFPFLVVSDNGDVSGFGGCNRLRTHLTQTETGYSFGPVVATRMFCPAIMTENRLTEALGKVVRAEGSPRGTLGLYDVQNNELLVLQQAGAPAPAAAKD
ncbi:META domain-containing protein [Acetobacter sp. AN02]|uniref:META domain-containing protein n=1 Tax=Acetobacter sp. AN02 TaxID=2894186 RepID=UPI002434547D|nr:META domain-containing protein [Acetobacter sp. AN02]MDG6094901.1 META domain-containing protein [Acetobacter sp. AN02]